MTNYKIIIISIIAVIAISWIVREILISVTKHKYFALRKYIAKLINQMEDQLFDLYNSETKNYNDSYTKDMKKELINRLVRILKGLGSWDDFRRLYGNIFSASRQISSTYVVVQKELSRDTTKYVNKMTSK